MFELFTDRARRVVVLAQDEARLLHHNFIGTQHILLGLIHEGEGVAAKALESLGISLEAVRQQVEGIIGQGGPSPSGYIPFTPRAKKVLELSLSEALQLGHNYIGTEHILLGLIREGEGFEGFEGEGFEGEGFAVHVLVKGGADLSRVRQQVIQLLSDYYSSRESQVDQPARGSSESSSSGSLVIDEPGGAAGAVGMSDLSLGRRLRQTLASLGTTLVSDPFRCRAVVLDVCGGNRRASRLLVAAIDAGVVIRLASTSEGDLDLLRPQMVSMLEADWGLHPDAALWAVQAWSTALGLPEQEKQPEPPASPTPTALKGTEGPTSLTDELSALSRSGEHADAMFNLGKLSVERGALADAEGWYRRSAESGHIYAMACLGVLLADRGDLAEAELWYRRSAEAGVSIAMTKLGILLYEHGDIAAAEEWLKCGAEAGNTNAMNALGLLLDERGDVVDAEVMWRRSAWAGNTMGMYEFGRALAKRGSSDAERWFRRSAEGGCAEAMFHLGSLLTERCDFAEAEVWWRRSAEAGNTEAMYILGFHLCERGDTEAEVWWRRSAEAGNTEAMNDLGYFLAKRGDTEAEVWWRRSAEAGNTDAMIQLSKLLAQRGDTDAEAWRRRSSRWLLEGWKK